MPDFGFVLEQTLGHVAHSRNLVRALANEPDIRATVIPIEFGDPAGLSRLPGLRTWSWRASVAARAALRERQREGPLDALFIHTQVAALLAGELMRAIPTVVSLDATPRLFDLEGDAYGHRRGGDLIETLKLRFNERAFAAATRIVTWSRLAADSLVADYRVCREKIDVIPPGVDIDLFQPGPKAAAGEPLRILFVGGQFERKGGPELLQAAGRLGSAVRLDLVTGSDVGDLPTGVDARVHRGLRPQSKELVELYRAADLFVLPSRGDCMPQAVAEALAAGLPVVASRVGAISEMVTDGINGRLIGAGDPLALAAVLEELVAAPERRAQMGRSSRQLAEREHDASRNNSRIFRLMESVAGSARSRLRSA